MQTTETPQPPPSMTEDPQAEHQWLLKLVGDWTCEGEATMAPGQLPTQWKSTETVRAIGGLWIAAEGRGEMPDGSTSITVMTLGYDLKKKRYVGTFVGSMMTNQWVYEGELDAGEKVLTLDTEGPDWGAGGRTAKYKDIIEIKSADHRLLRSEMQGEDGQWSTVMTANYRRT